MKVVTCCLALMLLVGCGEDTTDTALTPPVAPSDAVTVAEPDDSSELTLEAPVIEEPTGSRWDTPTGIAVESGSAKLTPQNTMIQFVGAHKGDNPDPRTGEFKDFAGMAVVEGGQLKSVSVEIQTASLETPLDKLNTHLKSPDFFDTREHPTAKFETTSIGDGSMTGNLTLLGETKEISFPVEIQVSDDSLWLSGQMQLDRTQFGMNYGAEKVEEMVELTIVVGR